MQKNTSRNKYPRESKMAPDAIETSASPKFWMDCMLIDTQEKTYVYNRNKYISSSHCRYLQAIGCCQLVLRDHESHHGPQGAGQ